jgi:hypothetical protein
LENKGNKMIGIKMITCEDIEKMDLQLGDRIQIAKSKSALGSILKFGEAAGESIPIGLGEISEIKK